MQDRDGVAVFVGGSVLQPERRSGDRLREKRERPHIRSFKDTKTDYAEFQESLVEDASGVEQDD